MTCIYCGGELVPDLFNRHWRLCVNHEADRIAAQNVLRRLLWLHAFKPMEKGAPSRVPQ